MDEAIKALKQALAIKPDFAEAYYNMGVDLSEIGKLGEAIDAYKNFIKYAPPQFAGHIEQVKQIIRDLQNRL